MAVPLFSIRLKPARRRRIDELVENGEYASISEFIDEAISHHLRYIEERDFRFFLMKNKGKRKKKR